MLRCKNYFVVFKEYDVWMAVTLFWSVIPTDGVSVRLRHYILCVLSCYNKRSAFSLFHHNTALHYITFFTRFVFMHNCQNAEVTRFVFMHDCQNAEVTIFVFMHDCQNAEVTRFVFMHDWHAEVTRFVFMHDCQNAEVRVEEKSLMQGSGIFSDVLTFATVKILKFRTPENLL